MTWKELLNETGVCFLLELLEGLSWSQTLDNMRFQAALKSKVHSNRVLLLPGNMLHSVAMASVAYRIGCLGVCKPQDNFSACLEC